jgi:hypothetical protein
VLVLVAVGAAFPAATTQSAPAAKPVQVHCSGGMVFLFWPKGHKAIPSADLGIHPAPHVDIYKSSSYKGSNLLGFVNQKGKFRFSSKCDKSTASAVSGGVPRNKVVTKRAGISCGDVGFADVRVSSIPGGTQVDLGAQTARHSFHLRQRVLPRSSAPALASPSVKAAEVSRLY